MTVRGLFAVSLLLLAGCLNLTTRLQPDDPTAHPTHFGRDCVPLILVMGIGTATMEEAMASGKNSVAWRIATSGRNDPSTVPIEPIRKVHRAQWTDYSILGLGARCIEVTGEP